MRGRRPNPPPAELTGAALVEHFTESLDATAGLVEPVWAMVAPPEWQAGAAELAGEKWREIARAMTALGTLGPENALALEMACKQWARWRLAEAQVDKLGPVIRAPVTGVPMQNPFLSIANAAGDRFARLAAELGLTPAMRGRVAKRPIKTAAARKPLDL